MDKVILTESNSSPIMRIAVSRFQDDDKSERCYKIKSGRHRGVIIVEDSIFEVKDLTFETGVRLRDCHSATMVKQSRAPVIVEISNLDILILDCLPCDLRIVSHEGITLAKISRSTTVPVRKEVRLNLQDGATLEYGSKRHDLHPHNAKKVNVQFGVRPDKEAIFIKVGRKEEDVFEMIFTPL